AATVAGMALLGACGDGDGGGDEPEARELAMAQFFGGPMFVAGQESRLPFGLAGTDGLLPTEETPTSLRVQIIDPDGSELGSPVEVARHDAGLPRAYFPLRVTIDEPGIYTARAEI